MKIRGESGAVPFRGAMVGGARPVAKAAAKVVAKAKAKSTAKAAKSLKKSDEKLKTEVIQKNSVRVQRPLPQGNKMMNNNRTEITKLTKSGELAKRTAKLVDTGKAKATVKINSSATKAKNKKLPTKNY